MSDYQLNFAKQFSAAHAFAFWKGRVALYAILKAMGVGEGDEIILPGYSCVMDVNPIMYTGAKPVYVDIEPNLYNINLDLLEEKITERTKAIIALHTYGYPAEMDRLMEIANRHNIPVIEDCCLALGSKYKGKIVGTFGKAAYFSFQWNKPFTTGLGGMAVTNDDELAANIQSLIDKELLPVPTRRAIILALQLCVYRTFIYPRTTALAQNIFRWLTKKGIVVGSSSMEELKKPQMADDFFMGISSTQARAGLRQLRKLESNIAHRRKMAKLYDELLLADGWDIPTVKVPDYMQPVLVRYPLRVTDKWAAIELAAQKGIELGTWFEAPLHPKETNHELYHYRWGQCPQAELAAKEVVNLPLHPRTSEKTIRRTVEFIRQFKPKVL